MFSNSYVLLFIFARGRKRVQGASNKHHRKQHAVHDSSGPYSPSAHAAVGHCKSFIFKVCCIIL